jgi:L-amino acid N-acyltransferase YncA
VIATAVEIRDLRPGDWPEVAAIYTEGVRDDSTFASRAPTWEAWDQTHSLQLVAVTDDRVLGWAALSPVSTRHVYRGVARSAVYVRADVRGRGIGRALMEALVARSEADGIWTLEASVFPENEASLRLHEAVGFRVVGVRERIGQREGSWRDTVLLERRSEVIE